jgi:hypothetical protein
MTGSTAEERRSAAYVTSQESYSRGQTTGAVVGNYALYPDSVEYGDPIPDAMTAVYDAYSRFERIRRVRQLVNHVFKRSHNWDGDGARATDRRVEERVTQLLCVLSERHIDMPKIYPLVSGGLGLEWSNSERDVTIEFEPDSPPQAYLWESSADTEWEGELAEAPDDFLTALGRFAA